MFAVSSLSSLLFINILSLSALETRAEHTFTVDYVNNQFLKDGLPFTYISGEMHYFRIPRAYWKDRLEKLKAAGCSTVTTYIEWSHHESRPGDYNFDEEHDIFEFLNIAQSLGLTAILRPGPYICAEREFGGLPAWLLTKNPAMEFRTSDTSYLYYVEKWFRVLLPMIMPHLYGNGGNVIMIQIENEYGSYPENDKNYLEWLADLVRNYTGDTAVLFTTDGYSEEMIKRGSLPEILATIDFGPTSTPVETMFESLRAIQPQGPLVNSELYVGWFSLWGRPASHQDTKAIVDTITALMEKNVSFSMYMFHGGTNFGFTSGSNTDTRYIADLTSYDYDAPITEAGDLTQKYEAIRNIILKNRNIDTDFTIQPIKEKGNYGTVELKPVCSLFSCPIGIDYLSSNGRVNFEAVGQYYGFMSYSTLVQIQPQDPSLLEADIRDRAVVYLDDVEVSTLQYTVINAMALPPTYKPGQTLRLLVENMGRRNFQLLSDCTKGIVGNVTIDGQLLNSWQLKGYPFPSEDIAVLDNLDYVETVSFPAIFRGEFILNKTGEPLDTFVSMKGWGKGLVFINGFNLGRYWQIGPQVTLYVPGIYLKEHPMENKLTIFELHYSNPSRSVVFLDKPIISTD